MRSDRDRIGDRFARKQFIDIRIVPDRNRASNQQKTDERHSDGGVHHMFAQFNARSQTAEDEQNQADKGRNQSRRAGRTAMLLRVDQAETVAAQTDQQ